MNGQVNDFLPLAAKVAGEFGNIPDSGIGTRLGVSKQAAHKLAHAALSSLREKLQQLGFSGLDTLGLLKSARSVPSPSEVDDFPPQP